MIQTHVTKFVQSYKQHIWFLWLTAEFSNVNGGGGESDVIGGNHPNKTYFKQRYPKRNI